MDSHSGLWDIFLSCSLVFLVPVQQKTFIQTYNLEVHEESSLFMCFKQHFALLHDIFVQ